jgi:type IV pilus assembly protein PilB
MSPTGGSSETGIQEIPNTKIEHLLLEERLVSEEQIERARRISSRMQKPRPVGEILVGLGQLARSEHDRVMRLYRSQLTLASILHGDGALDDARMARYEEIRASSPDKTERDLLLGDGLVTEEQYLKALSIKYEIPYIEPDVSLVEVGLLARIPLSFLIKQKVLPFRRTEAGLTVIMADPLNVGLIQDLELTYNTAVTPCGAPSDKIVEALKTLDRLRDSGDDEATTLEYHELVQEPEGEDDAEGAVQIVDHLLYQAIDLGASDLHIEPLQSKVRVRVRVDGVLRGLTDVPVDFAHRITARVKVLASMDIAERRLHQDGRFFVRTENREVDIRVSSYATISGETLVMRLLDRRRGLLPLDGLGFEPRVLTMLREVVLRASSGLVLVTGPTGSGKTTTMYSFVDYANSESLKVITCENPVEYTLEGTTQCSINEKSGPTFADSLKSIVRQDPDIIVVGEIRDKTTASLATEAALTGHKVFSTFHTEDAVTAVVRLLELGLEPFLVASTLSCVVAQRLIRRICQHCVRKGSYSRRDLQFLGLASENLAGMPILEGAGCAACGGTGFKGRSGIHEVLLLDDDFRDAILSRAPSKDLRRLARKLHGFLTLQEDGLLKVVAGTTTLSEIADNAPRDPEARPVAMIQEVAAMRRFR